MKNKPTRAQLTGKIIREARLAAGHQSAHHAAALLDVSPSTWYRWEQGVACPDLVTLDRIAEALGRRLVVTLDSEPRRW